MLAGLLITSLIVPGVRVDAASERVTFYLKGNFTTYVVASGEVTNSVTGEHHKIDSPSSSAGHDLLTVGSYTSVDDGGWSGGVSHGNTVTTTLNADGYYEATVDSAMVSAVIDGLEGHGQYGYYVHDPGCKKFEVTKKDGAYYAEQVQGDHSYSVVSPATFEHGTVYKCEYCEDSYTANDKLKTTLTFNATINGGTTAKTSQQCEGNSTVNLTNFTASKDGWSFVGWSTSSTAYTALSSIKMNNNKTVYAVFKKDLTVTFVD